MTLAYRYVLYKNVQVHESESNQNFSKENNLFELISSQGVELLWNNAVLQLDISTQVDKNYLECRIYIYIKGRKSVRAQVKLNTAKKKIQMNMIPIDRS